MIKDLFVIFRRDELEGRIRVIREEERLDRLGVREREKRTEIRRMTSLERFVCKRELCTEFSHLF